MEGSGLEGRLVRAFLGGSDNRPASAVKDRWPSAFARVKFGRNPEHEDPANRETLILAVIERRENKDMLCKWRGTKISTSTLSAVVCWCGGINFSLTPIDFVVAAKSRDSRGYIKRLGVRLLTSHNMFWMKMTLGATDKTNQKSIHMLTNCLGFREQTLRTTRPFQQHHNSEVLLHYKAHRHLLFSPLLHEN